jgi:hypothetical protein
MASVAHPSPFRGQQRPPGVLARVRRRLRRDGLDRAIAAGANPASSHDLAARSSELVGDEVRSATAAEIEAVVAQADEPPHPRRLSAAVPLARAALEEARPLLTGLVLDLREGDHVTPRGVAQARALIRDGGSPLYAGIGPGSARLEIAVTRIRWELLA